MHSIFGELPEMQRSTTVTSTLDGFAISTSAVCAIHCLCLPLLLGAFPALSATVFGQESFHVLLLWLVIPSSIVALSMGCRVHKDVLVAILGVAGLIALVAAATLGHDNLGESGERMLTLLGAAMIAAGHIRNFILCRRGHCDQ